MGHYADLAHERGLSASEATDRLRRDGPNELPTQRPRSGLMIALHMLTEPMLLLLVACAGVYLLLGDLQEAILLSGCVTVVMGITFYQERKTERALEALRDLSAPRALVIRDGKEDRIPGREVVVGDIIVLAEGDRIPADAVLRYGHSLTVDESLLTGESVPVEKRPGHTELEAPGGDGTSSLFSGALIVQGRGAAEVKATGARTELGKIGKSLEKLEPEKSLIKAEISRLVRIVGIAGGLVCLGVVVGVGLIKGDWLGGLLAGLTAAMSVLPEEFPVVLTIFLALGAWRLSKSQVLTRRVAAIETLGAATVLCVDKTGTLTQNRMTVARLEVEGRIVEVTPTGNEPLPEEVHALLEYGVLASQRDPFDPMERAIRTLGLERLKDTEHLHEQWKEEREYPLSPELLAVSHVWADPDRHAHVIAAKGAPEAIADLCHVDDDTRRALAQRVHHLADQGLRVLGVARALFTRPELPGHQHDFDFEFVGLIGLADPLRESVPAAVAECAQAGLRVVMITGDYPSTALSIAGQAGLDVSGGALTGTQMSTLDDAALAEATHRVNVFARMVPEQKLRLVRALQAAGEVVAMTGDGVNDAPALKAAHIGIAMGERGTDVAREAAALVLLDDDFASIVRAVRMGRRIFDNLRKATGYILAVHVPIAGLALLPILFGWPLLLLPVHIVFLELIIDPASSVVFEAEGEEDDIMRRPPRPREEPLVTRTILWFSLAQGISVLAITLGLYAFESSRGIAEGEARALMFSTLIVANLGLVLANRSWRLTLPETMGMPNPAMWWIVGGATAFLTASLTIPFMRDLFHFDPISMRDLAVSVLAGVAAVLWFEFVKVARRRRAVI